MDISLLPEEMKKRETVVKKSDNGPAIQFHVPTSPANNSVKSNAVVAVVPKKPDFFSKLFARKSAASKISPVSALPTVKLSTNNPPSPVRVAPSPVVSTPRPVSPPKPAITDKTLDVPKTSNVTPPTLPSLLPKPPLPKPPIADATLNVPRVSNVAPPPKPAAPPLMSKIPKAEAPRPTAQPAKVALHMAPEAKSGNLRVSLIPTIGDGLPDAGRGAKLTAAITVVALILAGVGYGLANWYVSGKEAAATAEISRNLAAVEGMNSLKKDFSEAQNAVKRLRFIGILLDNHLAWSKLFSMLETYTHRDVAFTQFGSEGLDTVSLQAEARNYRAIAEQVQALALAPNVAEVKIGDLSSEIAPTGLMKSVKLTLTIRFSPDLIKTRNKEQ